MATKYMNGDIVKDDYTHRLGVVKFTTEDVGSCGCCIESFTGVGFVAEAIQKNIIYGTRLELAESCEVVGNIYDNPELLGE